MTNFNTYISEYVAGSRYFIRDCQSGFLANEIDMQINSYRDAVSGTHVVRIQLKNNLDFSSEKPVDVLPPRLPSHSAYFPSESDEKKKLEANSVTWTSHVYFLLK